MAVFSRIAGNLRALGDLLTLSARGGRQIAALTT